LIHFQFYSQVTIFGKKLPQISREPVRGSAVRKIAAQAHERLPLAQFKENPVAELRLSAPGGIIQQPDVGVAYYAAQSRRETVYRQVNYPLVVL
jgi:hypothetical protein